MWHVTFGNWKYTLVYEWTLIGFDAECLSQKYKLFTWEYQLGRSSIFLASIPSLVTPASTLGAGAFCAFFFCLADIVVLTKKYSKKRKC